MDDLIKHTEKKTRWLLDLIDCPNTELLVNQDEEGLLNVQVNASDDEMGLLIGFHGEHISALQIILSQLVNTGKDTWNPVLLNVGDYREKRNHTLLNMAMNTADRVKQLGKPITLPYLSGNERRFIHLALAEDQEIETYSEGVGRERRLTVDKKH